MVEIFKYVFPFITAVVTGCLTYYFTKKSKMDDIKIKRGMEIAEKISISIQDIIEVEEHLYETYQRNYGHMQYIEEAVENFETMQSLYFEEYKIIKELAESKGQLLNNLKIGRVFLNSVVLDNIQVYVNIGKFSYIHDGSGLTNTYYLELFRNLINKENRTRRIELSHSIIIDERSKLF